MNTEIITIKQLPIIEEQLQLIKSDFEKQVENALSLEVNDESYKEIKKVRADLTKVYNDLENRRKDVKKAILSPYEAFEKIYKDCVTNVYSPAKQKLDNKISAVENGLKEQKKQMAIEYFDEYIQSKNIDFISIDDIDLNITLNSSLKSLKDKIKSHIDKACDDLSMINTQEFKEEILVEYKKSFNVSQAILKVCEYHRAVEEEKRRIEERNRHIEEKRIAAQQIERVIEQEHQVEFALPAVSNIEEEEKHVSELIECHQSVEAPIIYELQFKVKGSINDLKQLKEFLNNGGYKYEQC